VRVRGSGRLGRRTIRVRKRPRVRRALAWHWEHDWTFSEGRRRPWPVGRRPLRRALVDDRQAHHARGRRGRRSRARGEARRRPVPSYEGRGQSTSPGARPPRPTRDHVRPTSGWRNARDPTWPADSASQPAPMRRVSRKKPALPRNETGFLSAPGHVLLLPRPPDRAERLLAPNPCSAVVRRSLRLCRRNQRLIRDLSRPCTFFASFEPFYLRRGTYWATIIIMGTPGAGSFVDFLRAGKLRLTKVSRIN